MNNRSAILPLSTAFVLLWSSGFIGAQFGLGYAGTFTLLAWRYLVVALVLALLVTAYGAWRRLGLRETLRHAVVGVLAHAAWLAAVLGAIDLGVSAGLAALITALQPMVTATLSGRMTEERVGARQWLGLALGLGAVLLVVGDRIALGGSAIAYALPFVAVVAISLATLIERRAELMAQGEHARPTPILLVVFIHCAASLLVLAPAAALLEGFQARWGVPLVFSVLWLALVVSLAAYGLLFVLLRKMDATKVSCLTYLAPPVTMLIAWILFGESLGVMDMTGVAIAALAVWIVTGARFRGRPGRANDAR